MFFKHCYFDKNDTQLKSLDTLLSSRYTQTVQYQVVAQLNSFISNRQRDFRKIVTRSSLPDETKHKLHTINKCKAWFSPDFLFKKQPVEQDVLKLARCIFRQLLKRNRKPNLKHCNLNLDSKVAQISDKNPEQAIHFDYWIKLSTLIKGKPISIPLSTNSYYETAPGERKEFCQINKNRDTGELTFCFIKEQEREEYTPKSDKIAVDLGLRELMATDRGDLFGRNLIDELKHYDNILIKLHKEYNKIGLSLRTFGHNNIINYIRALLKQEVCRAINRIIHIYKPKELVIEALDFSNTDLSKQMNRLLRNCGLSVVKEKLEQVENTFGIIITYVHPAYSSKTCTECGYVDERNRPAQDCFKCRLCRYGLNADVKAARMHSIRSSYGSYDPNKSRRTILNLVIESFLRRQLDWIEKQRGHKYSVARLLELISSNKYFQKLSSGNRVLLDNLRSKGFCGKRDRIAA